MPFRAISILHRQDMDRARGAQADNVGLAGLRAFHLAILRALIFGQMPHDFADVGHAGRAQRMTFAKQSARSVNRAESAEVGMHAALLVDELARRALLGQEQILVVNQFCGGEAVMQFGQIDVLGSDAGGLVPV